MLPLAEETPQEHARTALMLLDDVERALRALGPIVPADAALELLGPLAAARGRLWRAVTALEQVTTDVVA